LPGDFAVTFEKEGVKVGVIGLNSTFLQIQAGDFMKRLALHPIQIETVCGEEFAVWFRERHTNLLLTHQPPDWLTPDSLRHLDAEIAPPSRFAMHFFGHMHESRSLRIATAGAPLQRRLQGCSLFGLEVWGQEQQRSHGFSLGTFSFTPGSREAILRIWPRKCEKHQAGHLHLVRDPGFTLRDDGGTDPEIIALNKPVPGTYSNLLRMEFVRIPAGEFQMSWKSEKVHISQFYLGKYPVTQAQWANLMGRNPSRFLGDSNRPVETVFLGGSATVYPER